MRCKDRVAGQLSTWEDCVINGSLHNRNIRFDLLLIVSVKSPGGSTPKLISLSGYQRILNRIELFIHKSLFYRTFCILIKYISNVAIIAKWHSKVRLPISIISQFSWAIRNLHAGIMEDCAIFGNRWTILFYFHGLSCNSAPVLGSILLVFIVLKFHFVESA